MKQFAPLLIKNSLGINIDDTNRKNKCLIFVLELLIVHDYLYLVIHFLMMCPSILCFLIYNYNKL